MTGPTTARSTPDRRWVLVVAGVVLAGTGIGCVGLAGLSLVASSWLPEGTADPMAAWSSAAMSIVIGGVLVVLGVGVGRGRSDAVAVARSTVRLWLVTGIATLAVAAWMVPALVGSVTGGGAGTAVLLVEIVLWGVLVVGCAAMPAVLLWMLLLPGIEETCRRQRPATSWVDDCPPRRLTLAVVWALLAVSAIGMGSYRFLLPAGGVVLIDGAGAAGWAMVLVGTAWLAWITATGGRGWWAASLVATAAAAVLTTATLAVVPPSEIAAEVPGPTGAMLEALLDPVGRPAAVGVNLLVWATLAVLVARCRSDR